MTIPDYLISRTIAEERQQQHFQQTTNTDLQEPRSRNEGTSGRIAAVRRQLGAALHAVASRIEPEPAGSR